MIKLPPSNRSPISIILFSQTGLFWEQTDGDEFLQEKPGSTLQFCEHPIWLKLLHCSLPYTIPWPHREQKEGWPTTALQLKPESIVQLFEHPSLPFCNWLFLSKGKRKKKKIQ